METESKDAEKVTITELLNLRNLGVSIADINWNRIKMVSSDYICIRHKRQSNSAKKSDANSSETELEANYFSVSRKQSLPCNLNEINRRQPSPDAISIIDANSAHIKSYELNGVTSAAVCPIKSAASSAASVSGSADHQANEAPSLLALTTADIIYVIDLASDQIIAWNRFPFKKKFWSWIDANVIVIIGDYDTVHWNIVTDEMVPVFKINPRLGGAQIYNYTASDDFSWHALTGLIASDANLVDANFSRQKSSANLIVEGLTQIYSANQNASNVILAQVATFTSYTFPGNSAASNFLITLNKMAPSLMKIHLVELFDGTKNSDAESNHSIEASLSDANLGDANLEGAKNSDANLTESADFESNRDQRQSLISKSSTVFIDRIDDFPMSIIIRRSLIFVTTKYGLFYAFHFETLSPLIVAHQVATGVILSSALDNFYEDAKKNLDADSKSGGAKNLSAKKMNPSIIAITKSGQVLEIKLNMKSMIRRLLDETLNLKDAKILIASKLISDFNIDMNTEQVTRL